MSSGPDDRSTGTIKFGKDFEAPWFVASGNPDQIRRQLLEFAGWSDQHDKTLAELMVEVAADTQAKWALRSKAGAQKLPAAKVKADTATVADATPVAQQDEGKAEDPNAFIFEAIADASTTEELKRVFAKNKDAFTANKELQTAFVERKSALA